MCIIWGREEVLHLSAILLGLITGKRRQAYQLERAIGLGVIKPLLTARMYKLLMAAMSGISYLFVIAATRSLELIFMWMAHLYQ